MLATVASFLLLSTQDVTEQDLHGKTLAEIVEMGREGWYEFYTSKEGGESTQSMSFAEYYYGSALKAENDKLFDPLSEKGKTIAFFRVNMQDFRTKCIDVGRAYTGGGTMWNIVYSATTSDTEEVIRYWLTGKEAPKKAGKVISATQAKVWAMLKQGRVDLQRNRSEIMDGAEFSRIEYRDVEKSMNEAMGLFSEGVGKMDGLSEPVKKRMFSFYLQAATITNTPDLP